jgi:hypothetical protein
LVWTLTRAFDIWYIVPVRKILLTSVLLVACEEEQSVAPGSSGSPSTATSGAEAVIGAATNNSTTGEAQNSTGATISSSGAIAVGSTAGTTGTTGGGGTSASSTDATATTSGEVTTGGAGGTGSMTTTDGSSTTGTAAACEGNYLLCDDFESAVAGSLPMGPQWLGIDDAACGTGNFDLAVSNERAFSGTQSLKITNASWAQCRIAASFAQSEDFWLRANLYWDESVDFTNKEVLAIDLAPGTNLGADDPAIRFGSRTKEPCTQNGGAQVTIIGLGNGESTGCDGDHPLPQATWYCFEAHVTQSEGNISVKTYINGQGLTYSSIGKDPAETVDTAGATALVEYVRLGMFSTTSNLSGVVFVDDIAISETQVGCNSR